MVKAAFPALLLALAAAGCTQSVRRAALVPHLQPSQRSGQPLARPAEIAVGAGSIVDVSEPRADHGAGVQIPQTQVNAGMRFQTPRRDLDLGFVWDHGAEAGSHKGAEDQPTVDNGDVVGGGVTMHYSVATRSPAWRVGLSADLLFYSVPYVEYQTCVDCVGEPWTEVERKRELVPVVALGAIPSFRSGWVTLFGGVTVRNHPLVDKSEVENELGEDLDEEVRAGPFNLVASAGVELGEADGVRGLLQVYQPLGSDPVRYGPSFGVSVAIPLGSAAPAPAAATPGPGPGPLSARR